MTAPSCSIAVIGIACRFPGADDRGQFWTNLVGGVDAIERAANPDDELARQGSRRVRAIGRVRDVEWFDADYFRIPPHEAMVMDPQQRLCLEVAACALQDAGYEELGDQVAGVFVGSGENLYVHEHVAPDHEIRRRMGKVRIALANERDLLPARLAFKLGLTGPNVNVQAGCATSLTAIALACQSLAAGDCDLAVAGASTLLLPTVDGYDYEEGGVESADGYCRSFDRAGSGPVPGSGVGIVVLKRADRAGEDRDHQYAVIRGWALGNDGGSRAGFGVPNVAGQEAVARLAVARAGVDASMVGFIEAHGAATPIGDAVEVEALRRVYSSAPEHAARCAIGSVKTNIGHADTAAGVAGFIKAVGAVEAGTIPPSLHFRAPSPAIAFEDTRFFVNTAPCPWPDGDAPRLAAVSSIGLGGSNAHVIVEQPPAAAVAPSARSCHPLILSARTEAELAAAQRNLAAWFEDRPELSHAELADVAHSLAVGRATHLHRWSRAFSDPSGVATALRQDAPASPPVARWGLAVEGSPAAMAAMGRRIAEQEPLVHAASAEVSAAVGPPATGTPPDVVAARLALVACVRALRGVGLTFAHVTSPAWAAPVLPWCADGRPLDGLGEALAAGTGGEDTVSGADRATVIALGPDFAFAEALAAIWAAGGEVDWRRFYASDRRGRTPLPTYPFSRRRYWLEAPEVPGPGAVVAQPRSADAASDTIVEMVERVWLSVFGYDEIDRTAHFVDDLGGDSLIAAEIGARLTAMLGVEIPIDLPIEASTIAEVARRVEALTNGSHVSR